jgi:hypothetical protein
MEKKIELRTRLNVHRIAYSAVFRAIQTENVRVGPQIIAFLKQFAEMQRKDEVGVVMKDELLKIINSVESDKAWKPVVIAGGKR